jgi:hypothetical protein
MAENQKPKASGPRPPQRAFTTDSAEHLMAAFPILTAIANWTGKIGLSLIKTKIISGNIKQARRNAVIVVSVVVVVFLSIIGCIVWLAGLK